MATTVSSCSFTSICPRTKESEMDSMSKVIARITLGSGAKTLRKVGNRKDNFLTRRERFHTDGVVRYFIRAVRDEERDAALYRVLNLIAKRAVREINEDASALRAELVGKCLCGGNITHCWGAEIKLRVSRTFARPPAI